MTDLDSDRYGAAQNAKQRLVANLATPRLREAVACYFDPAQPFAGLTFDSLGNNPPNQIIPDDLLAVTLLDVRWTPLAVRLLLNDQAAKVSELLGQIDDKTEMWASDGRKQLDAVEPLWDLLYRLPGVRDTRASKLLARKRPRLVPITDSIIVSAVGTPGQTWVTLHHCFQDDRFRQRVESLRPAKTRASACYGSSMSRSGCCSANRKRRPRHDVRRDSYRRPAREPMGSQRLTCRTQASSSRSQVAARTASAAACLTWERPSVSVHWRPLLAVAIVTQLVTRSLVSMSPATHGSGGGWWLAPPPGK